MINDKVTIEEIEKWLGRIEVIVDKIQIDDPRGEALFTNMKAYIEDSKHFMENNDYVRSFEAVVWAWSIFELCHDLGVFSIEEVSE